MLGDLLAEIDLRITDDTLSADQAAPLRTCIEQPRAWQRQQIAAAHRPQVYRPLLVNLQPNWRSYLPGVMVIVAGTPCVVVDRKLAQLDSAAYKFLLSFARDNELQLVEACLLPDPPSAKG